MAAILVGQSNPLTIQKSYNWKIIPIFSSNWLASLKHIFLSDILLNFLFLVILAILVSWWGSSYIILKWEISRTISPHCGSKWFYIFRGFNKNVKSFNMTKTDKKWWEQLIWHRVMWAILITYKIMNGKYYSFICNFILKYHITVDQTHMSSSLCFFPFRFHL